MSNDNKTLADVQPGGRVRLGDQAEQARFEAWAEERELGTAKCSADGMKGDYADLNTDWCWAAWRAALSAQPSPGGQDALIDALADDVESCVSDACGYLASDSGWDDYGIYRDDAEERYRALPDRIRALAARQPVGDQHPDDLAVDAFAAAMKAKMAEARAKGRGGWEDPAQCTAEDLSRMLRDHVEKGDPRDVANFCMMLNQRGEAIAACQAVGRSFQAGVAEWMGQCFLPPLYSDMTERGDRLLEEVLELLQANGYDSARVPTLVNYVFGRPVGEPAQEVGGVMVTLAGYCWVAGLDMHAAGDAELARISQPEVMAKIRAKQEAKNALQFDTPLPGNAAEPMFYLQDRRQYVGNCPLWWAIGGAGYTTRIDQAQRYTRAEAYDQNRTRDTDVPWPCEQIDALVRPTIDYQDLRRLPREEVQQ